MVTYNMTINVELTDFQDMDLINEIKDRGYHVLSNDDKMDLVNSKKIVDDVYDLYTSFLLDDKKDFEANLKEYFRENVGAVIK